MSTKSPRDQANDSENPSQEVAEQDQDPQPEVLPKGATQQSATGTGSIKVSG